MTNFNIRLRRSDPIRNLTILQSPVFLVNSRHPQFFSNLQINHKFDIRSPEVTEPVCRVPSI